MELLKSDQTIPWESEDGRILRFRFLFGLWRNYFRSSIEIFLYTLEVLSYFPETTTRKLTFLFLSTDTLPRWEDTFNPLLLKKPSWMPRNPSPFTTLSLANLCLWLLSTDPLNNSLPNRRFTAGKFPWNFKIVYILYFSKTCRADNYFFPT